MKEFISIAIPCFVAGMSAGVMLMAWLGVHGIRKAQQRSFDRGLRSGLDLSYEMDRAAAPAREFE